MNEDNRSQNISKAANPARILDICKEKKMLESFKPNFDLVLVRWGAKTWFHGLKLVEEVRLSSNTVSILPK